MPENDLEILLLPEVSVVVVEADDVAVTSLVAAEAVAVADFAEDSAGPCYEGGTLKVPFE